MKTPLITRPLSVLLCAVALSLLPSRAADPPVPVPAPAPELRTLLQQALFEEEATRDFEKAAAGYETLLTRWTEQRRYAASALFRLAEVRRKQNRKDDAIKLYQRLLAEFPDQDPETRLSRENLAALGVKEAPPAAAVPAAAPMSPEEEREMGRLLTVAENSPARLLEPVPWPESGDQTTTIGVLSNAARHGWRRVAVWLLDHGADPNANPGGRGTPLYHAAYNGYTTLCELLFARGAKPESALGALASAIANNLRDVADLLVKKGVNLNLTGTFFLDPVNKCAAVSATPLVAAIARENHVWTDRLLSLKADVNSPENKDITALHVACWKKDAALVKRLLELGAKTDAVDDFIGDDRVDTLALQWQRGKGWTPLHYAVTFPACVEALLKAGAKPDAKDEEGLTPLQCACFLKEEESVRLLLAAGADPNAPGVLGRTSTNQRVGGGTALHFAVLGEAPSSLIERLLKAGAKADALDLDGQTVLHPAVSAQQTSLLDVLLRAGVPADVPDKNGSAALATAFQLEVNAPGQQPAAIVDLLLKYGADPERPGAGKYPVFLSATGPRRVSIMRDRIYPKLAAAKAITLTFPEQASHVRLTQSENEGDAPPPFAELMIASEGPARAARQGQQFTFTSISIWRTKAGGGMEQIPVQTAGDSGVFNGVRYDTPLPALQWGDVIEAYTDPEKKAPQDTLATFRERLVRKVTVEIGGRKQEFTLRGRLHTYDVARAEAPLISIDSLMNLLGAAHPDFSDAKAEVRHGTAKDAAPDKNETAMVLPLAMFKTPPQDGDIITLKKDDDHGDGRNRTQKIFLTVPGKMAAWKLPGNDKYPTLVQFLAELYSSWSMAGPYDESADPDKWTDAERAARMLALEYTSLDRPVVSWPDWAGIKIKRYTGKIDQIEETIPVDLAAAMANLKPDALPDAALLRLQPGDIVELPVLSKHPDGAWPGLDEAAMRLFQRALTTKVTLANNDGSFRDVTGTWLPPRWVDTSAGLLPVPAGIAETGKFKVPRAASLVDTTERRMQVIGITREGEPLTDGTINPENQGTSAGRHFGEFFLRSGDVLHLSQRQGPPVFPQAGIVQPYVPLPAPPSIPAPVDPARRRVTLPTPQSPSGR